MRDRKKNKEKKNVCVVSFKLNQLTSFFLAAGGGVPLDSWLQKCDNCGKVSISSEKVMDRSERDLKEKGYNNWK